MSFEQQQNGNYPSPPQHSYIDPNELPMSMGDWFITFLILCVPIVNIVMLFVWAFGSGNKNRKNFCLASLIFSAIGFCIALILVVLVAILGIAMY